MARTVFCPHLIMAQCSARASVSQHLAAQLSPVAPPLQLRPRRHCCRIRHRPRPQHITPKGITTNHAYRWSPGDDSDGRRRDDLLDNVEPADTPSAQPNRYSRQKRTTGEPPSADADEWGTSESGPSSQRDGDTDIGTSADVAAEDDSGWGRPARVPTEDWGWPETSPSVSVKAADDAWDGAALKPAPEKRGDRDPTARQGSSRGKQRAGAAESDWEEDEDPNENDWEGEAVPDITLLTTLERDRVLPLSPFREQVDFFRGDAAQNVQRLGGALLITILAASKAAVVAAGALTFPFWWPWLQAAKKNGDMKTQYRYVGLWRAEVLESEVVGRRPASFAVNAGARRRQQTPLQPTLELLVGDASGARAEISVPYSNRLSSIRIGEPAELLVISKGATFYDFKALQEAYLPESGAWLARYPFMDKDVFLDISLDIERERRQQDDEEDRDQDPDQGEYW